MSLRENITAVIETCFSETKDEIQDTAISRILELIRADRKTEPNCSEKPNNCDTCRNKGFEGCEQPCLGCGCCGLYEPKDESQNHSGEATEMVKDEPQTELVNDSPILAKDLVDDEFNPYDEECMRCKHLKLKCEFIPTYCKFESRDEGQTERSE